ncbi:MAG TPA: hypothetical protein DDZ88_10795 [Verrucomicrobiales bacterium]|nr:hypothetical protein [Verrucomicrobiales bacterium]
MGLESDLATALSHSEELASVQGEPGDWETGCHHQWDLVEDILDVIHGLVSEMHTAIISSDEPGALRACAAWAAIQEEGIKLAAALAGMRAQSLELDETARGEWLELVLTVESYRKVVQTAAKGIGARLEAWKAGFSVMGDAASLAPPARPGVDGMEPAAYTRKFDQAAVEIEQEQHQVLDLKDDIKAMFMWVETPEERVLKNPPAKVQAA